MRALISDFGAVCDGQTDDTRAIQAAIRAVGDKGGGTVVVPGGRRSVCGQIRLVSGVELHLENGSVLLASSDPDRYGSEGFGCVIETWKADNCAITGTGTIDARGLDYMRADLTYIYEPMPWRPRLVGFVDCRNLTIRDVTFRDSPNWTLHLVGCEHVNIDGVTIDNNTKIPNCDGIDPDHCRHVTISNCRIKAGDDGIVLKNTKEFADRGPCEDINITNCQIESTSAAIKIGSESVSDFRRITITGCVIRSSHRGVAVQLRDQGNVSDLIVSGCVIETRLFEDHWWGKAEPVYLTSVHRFGSDMEQTGFTAPDWNPENRLGTIHRVHISDLMARGENGIVVYGTRRSDGSSSVRDISFADCRVDVLKTSRWKAGRIDIRPYDTLGPGFRDPETDPGLIEADFAGVSITAADTIRCTNCEIRLSGSLPAGYGNVLELADTRGIELDGFRGYRT